MSESPTLPPPPAGERGDVGSPWTRAREWRTLGLLGVVALAFVGPLIFHLTAVGGELDWRYFQMLWEVDRKSVMEFGQLPFWNPYYCGGNAQLGNPQSQFFSLATPFSLLLGAAVGLKFHILIHYILGLWGGWRLGRLHGLTPRAAFGTAVVFALSGFFAMRAGGGHSAFFPFFFMPWAVVFYLLGKRGGVDGGLALGLCLALMIMEGGMYPVALTGGLLAFVAGFDFWAQPSVRRGIVRTAVVSLCTVLPAAVIKLAPVMEFVREFPREVPVKDAIGLSRFISMFVSRSMERRCEGCIYVWPEYINYVGPVVLLVFVLSVVRIRDLRWRRAYVTALLASLVLMGNQGAWAPYVLLHKLPPYDSLRVPGRWALLVVLQMALLFGAFLDSLPDFVTSRGWMTPRRAGGLATALLVVVGLDMGLQNARLWSPGFHDIPPAVTSEPFRQERGGAYEAYLDVQRNRGTVACYENVQLPTSTALWMGPGEQVRVKGEGTARLARFSPNEWVVETQLNAPGVVLLNQNFHRLWRIADGEAQLVNRDGLLALEVGAGPRTITVRYQPSFFWVWALISVATWGGALTLLWRRRARPTSPLRLLPLPEEGARPMAPVPPPTAARAPVTSSPVDAELRPITSAWKSSLVAGSLTGVVFGAAQVADLASRGLAPGEGWLVFGVLGTLAEGGLCGALVGLVIVVIRSVLWRGHAVGRALSNPLRALLAFQATQDAGAHVFANVGGALVGMLGLSSGVGGLVWWSQKAFNARELAAALVGVLTLLVVPAAVGVGALVRAVLLRLVLGPMRRWRAGRWLGALPWLLTGVAALAWGIRAAAPVLKDTDLRPAFYPLLTFAFALVASLLVQASRRASLGLALLCWLGSALAGLTAVFVLPQSSAAAVLMERGILTGPTVKRLRTAFDADGDGYSRVLGGGDCDDRRADVHPGALDIPDNGVDEDCSGADFHVPPRAPDVHNAALPEGLGPYKNVLLVVVDTLRQDRLHLFGNPRETTPFLDRFAQSSSVFDNAYANGIRSHRSIPSILTGRYPSRLHMAEGRTELMTLLPDNLTLAERLAAQGYGAASFILEKYFEGQEGLTQGFDFHNPRRVDPTYQDWSRPQGAAVANAAMKWITEHQAAPWLVWTHFYDPHLYWHDTPFGPDEIARYDAAVLYVDAQLGRLVEFVKGLPDADRTLIILTADHGQGLGTHGEWGHGQNLWQEDIHVPMLIHAPGFPPQRLKTVVENVDLVPTILNLLGKTQGVDPLLDGKTLVPLLRLGDAAANGNPGVAITEGLTDGKQPHNRRAVVQGHMKLLLDLDAGSTQLLDVEADRLERNNLAAQQPQVVEALNALLANHNALSALVKQGFH